MCFVFYAFLLPRAWPQTLETTEKSCRASWRIKVLEEWAVVSGDWRHLSGVSRKWKKADQQTRGEWVLEVRRAYGGPWCQIHTEEVKSISLKGEFRNKDLEKMISYEDRGEVWQLNTPDLWSVQNKVERKRQQWSHSFFAPVSPPATLLFSTSPESSGCSLHENIAKQVKSRTKTVYPWLDPLVIVEMSEL